MIKKLMSVKEESDIQKKELLNLQESYSLLKVLTKLLILLCPKCSSPEHPEMCNKTRPPCFAIQLIDPSRTLSRDLLPFQKQESSARTALP